MRAAARTRARALRFSFSTLAAVTMLLGAAGARADEATTELELSRLQREGEALAAASRSVLLELYAVESRLGRVQAELADLRGRADEVEREQDAARRHLALVRADLEEGHARLADRLRRLYTEDEPDPLAVLLGAESLDEAVSTLDTLGRFAGQDRRIIAQVTGARRAVERALQELADRRAELAALTREAAAAEAELLAARAERQAYLTRLREERRLNAAQLARATAAAQAAEERARAVAASAVASGGGPASGSTAPSAASEDAPPASPAPPPAPTAAPPAGSGTQMTVLATAYSLPGTTATGIPVGWGVVAVDPSVIPLGTRMTIPGYGAGVAADTGSGVRGAMIDLWFPTRAQALAWGRRSVTITLH